MQLDLEKQELLVKISTLHAAYPGVLSDFEVRTLWDVNARALEHDLEAATTAAEWDVVLIAHDALVKASRDSALALTPELAHKAIGDAVKMPSEASA